jgi:hypothetical protein
VSNVDKAEMIAIRRVLSFSLSCEFEGERKSGSLLKRYSSFELEFCGAALTCGWRNDASKAQMQYISVKRGE